MLKSIIQNIYIKFILNDPIKRAKYLKEKKGYRIGLECEIFKNVSFGSEPYLISLGNKVKVTEGVQFITHDGGIHVLRNLSYCKNGDKFGQIKVGNNVFIGKESLVLPGVTIGNNCVIGARSVVSKDIPDNSIVAGVPTKLICDVQEYWNKNRDIISDTKHLSSEEKKIYLCKLFNIEY